MGLKEYIKMIDWVQVYFLFSSAFPLSPFSQNFKEINIV